jgi:hypothetical protein
MHESGNGTFQTCQAGLTKAVYGGKADLADAVIDFRKGPKADMARYIYGCRY